MLPLPGSRDRVVHLFRRLFQTPAHGIRLVQGHRFRCCFPGLPSHGSPWHRSGDPERSVRPQNAHGGHRAFLRYRVLPSFPGSIRVGAVPFLRIGSGNRAEFHRHHRTDHDGPVVCSTSRSHDGFCEGRDRCGTVNHAAYGQPAHPALWMAQCLMDRRTHRPPLHCGAGTGPAQRSRPDGILS